MAGRGAPRDQLLRTGVAAPPPLRRTRRGHRLLGHPPGARVPGRSAGDQLGHPVHLHCRRVHRPAYHLDDSGRDGRRAGGSGPGDRPTDMAFPGQRGDAGMDGSAGGGRGRRAIPQSLCGGRGRTGGARGTHPRAGGPSAGGGRTDADRTRVARRRDPPHRPDQRPGGRRRPPCGAAARTRTHRAGGHPRREPVRAGRAAGDREPAAAAGRDSRTARSDAGHESRTRPSGVLRTCWA